MSSKADKERQKQVHDKCQALLTQMLRDDDNKYCVDCDSKGPRWASWNLGVFLCIRCAGIHRNLGVHISRVKSVTLDSWTPEQVVSLQMMGNSRARAVYEANLPDNFRRPTADSAMEAFVRAKYEAKKYIAKEWVQPPLPVVNWDKEFEEEVAERNRKRKKQQDKVSAISATSSKSVTPVATRKVDSVVPQPLPKPNASPKSQRQSAAAANNSPSKPSTDLLGLDSSVPDPVSSSANSTSDEMFTNFLSAPVATFTNLANSSKTNALNSSTSAASSSLPGQPPKRTPEEDSFFNQPMATEKKQLTTDSILALYAKAPPATAQIQAPVSATNFVQGGPNPLQSPFIASNFGRQGTSQQMPNFSAQTSNGVVPGMMNVQNTMLPMMVNPPNQMSAAAASNPFYNMSSTVQPQMNFAIGSQPQMMTSNLMNQQRCGVNPTTLHQQMAGISLNQGTIPSSAPVSNFGAFVQSQPVMPMPSFPVMPINLASNSTPIPGPTLSSNLS